MINSMVSFDHTQRRQVLIMRLKKGVDYAPKIN
jgi:hypothetical protein